MRGLAQVGRTLAGLHAIGEAHRALRPEALIAARDRMWLRDAGLAATPPAAGEGPAAYRAPEQDRPGRVVSGPAVDVYQIAALVHHLATGEPAGRTPAPSALLRTTLAGGLSAPLLAALSADPCRRPTLPALIGAFDRALREGRAVRPIAT